MLQFQIHSSGEIATTELLFTCVRVLAQVLNADGCHQPNWFINQRNDRRVPEDPGLSGHSAFRARSTRLGSASLRASRSTSSKYCSFNRSRSKYVSHGSGRQVALPPPVTQLVASPAHQAQKPGFRGIAEYGFKVLLFR